MDQATSSGMKLLETFFEEHPTVKYVRLHWVDYSGALRARIVPKLRCLQIARGENTYSLAQNCMIFPISAAPDCFPEGPEYWKLVPDWSSIRICGYTPKHAAVLCYVDQRGTKETYSKCPRAMLERTARHIKETHNADILIGFEIEFVLLDKELKIYQPFDRISAFSTMAGLRNGTLTLMEDIVEAMERSGIQFYHFHAEGIDHLEIALAPLPPMEAVDALMYTQEAMRTIAIQHNVKATTIPRPVLDGPNNGCHMHLSLNSARLAEPFIAGVMDKLTAVCAFGMPNYDSYVRIGPDKAGEWVGYGTENRDLPVRRVTDTHWEIRIVDATANLYLFLATLLEAGSQGILSQRNLGWKDCIVPPEDLKPDELAEHGIVDRLPTTLREALEIANADPDIHKWVGDDLLKAYFGVKNKEVELFSRMSDETRRQKYLVFF